MLSERVISAFAALKQPSPWRNRALAALGILLALAGAFSAGRFSGPAKVETKVETKTVEVEKVVYQDRVVEKVVVQKEAAKTMIVWRDRVIAKDGTITEHEIEKSATDSKVSIADNTERTATLTDNKATSAASTSSTTVTALPRWRVGVMVGAQYPQPLLPIAGPLVLGVFGEYRIVGGLSAGLWVTTGLAGGALVSFDF